MEEKLIVKIKSGIFGMKNNTKTPQEVGKFLNQLKILNKPMYDELFNDYKAALEIWKTNAQSEPGTWFTIDANQSKETVVDNVVNAWQQYCLIKSNSFKLNSKTTPLA